MEGNMESPAVYAIGHLGGQIRDFAGDGSRWGLDVAYVDEGETLLGTGGAVRGAIDEADVGDEPNGGFLVLYGDSYLSIDIAALWAASGDGGHPVMSVLRNDGQWDASNAAYDGAMVTCYEKGRSDGSLGFIDYGISVLNGGVIREHVAADTPYDLADVFHRLAEAGQLRGFEATERFYEIGSPQGLADLEAFLGGQTLTSA